METRIKAIKNKGIQKENNNLQNKRRDKMIKKIKLTTEEKELQVNNIINKLISRSDAIKNSDGSYSFNGNVDLSNLGLVSFPIRFKDVKGYSYCNGNKLKSLKGAPQIVLEDFHCSGNNFTSLEGFPQTVGGNFYCYNKKTLFTVEDIKLVSDVKGVIYR